MTGGDSEQQRANDVNAAVEAAMDERGPKDKTRRVLDVVADRLERLRGTEDAVSFLRRLIPGNPTCNAIEAIIAEPDHRREMLANVGDEATVRGLVEEAEAENYGPEARLNVGLLSASKAAFVHRMLDLEANGTHMIRLGYAKGLIDEVTEGKR